MVTAYCLLSGPEWSIVRLEVPFPKPTHPTPPLPNSGKVARFSRLENSGPLTTICHLFREPAVLKEQL